MEGLMQQLSPWAQLNLQHVIDQTKVSLERHRDGDLTLIPEAVKDRENDLRLLEGVVAPPVADTEELRESMYEILAEAGTIVGKGMKLMALVGADDTPNTEKEK